jgi:ArsR family transcriptional regulator, arsenate/arsenite/antimonite-responsive transcriptional repressor
MEKISALAALAQEKRLDVFRLLVEAGPDGMPAGAVAEALRLAPNTLTFHFDRLRHAGLVTVQREGRSMIYAARFETMNALIGFLTENCCGGVPDKCKPAPVCKPVPAKRARLPGLREGPPVKIDDPAGVATFVIAGESHGPWRW